MIGRRELNAGFPRCRRAEPVGIKRCSNWGLKWRCLKEQRKKFAITMTVNIQRVRVVFLPLRRPRVCVDVQEIVHVFKKKNKRAVRPC